jgi:SAM-dependent methyltransferase
MNEQERIDRTRRLFDEWARTGRDEGMERGHGPAARQAFDRLAIRAGQHFLDIGCGNGYTVRWATDIDPSVQGVGIDVSGEMIERARTQVARPNARFIHAPFPLPMLKAKSFDAVLSMEVFYYFPDLTWAVLSTARLLKPGGLFACVVDYYEENVASHGWPESTGLPMTLLSAAGWWETMEAIGLEVVEQDRLYAPLEPGAKPGWKQEVGSLLTLARRPATD